MKKDFEKTTAYLALGAIENLCKVNGFGKSNDEIYKIIKDNHKEIASKDIIPDFENENESKDYMVELLSSLVDVILDKEGK